MRHRGSVSQVNIDRDKMIISLYRKALGAAAWPTTLWNICETMSTMPTPQFYISFDTAIYYIRCRYYQEIEKKFRNPFKQKLFDALYARFLELVEKPEHCNMKMKALVMMALDSPAPCLGMSTWMIYNFIRIRRKKMKHHVK